jgi:hypothetical protein
MQVPDEIQKCVAFFGYRREGVEHIRATGFFLTVRSDGSLPIFTRYFVTAKHVIDRAKDRSDDGKLIVRVNHKTEGAVQAEYDFSLWRFHPTDTTVDVAVGPVALNPDEIDYLCWENERIATREIMQREEIGIGCDVFMVGLFRNHIGEKRNIPILRVGNIAAMPDDRIASQFGRIEAYLIEARSIGGLSGSPVFAALDRWWLDKQGNTSLRKGKMHYLLGLMHGHFPWSGGAESSVIDNASELDEISDSKKINTGIGIVVPAEKIMEVINQPELMAERELACSKLRAELAYASEPARDRRY